MFFPLLRDGIVVTDVRTREIVLANDVAGEIFGYGDALVGMHEESLVPEHERAPMMAAYAHFLETGTNQVLQTPGPTIEVLRRVGQAIRSELRASDSAYRYGGEEFLIVLPGQDVEMAAGAMERVRGAVERLSLPQASSPPGVTISIGVADFYPDVTGDYLPSLRRVDAALYDAKDAGRNRIVARATARDLSTRGIRRRAS